MIRNHLIRLDAFLRNHWVGIVLVTVATGVLGNFAYDFVKPKESVSTPRDQVNVSPRNSAVDPQLSAQAMRASASSLRAIAANHMRSPPPAKWQQAEHLFKSGMEQYANSDFHNSYLSFNSAYRIYNDLYEQAKFEGH
jgi:hypothetical protein